MARFPIGCRCFSLNRVSRQSLDRPLATKPGMHLLFLFGACSDRYLSAMPRSCTVLQNSCTSTSCQTRSARTQSRTSRVFPTVARACLFTRPSSVHFAFRGYCKVQQSIVVGTIEVESEEDRTVTFKLDIRYHVPSTLLFSRSREI